MTTESLLIIHDGDYQQLISLLKKDFNFEFLYTNVTDKDYSKKQLQISSKQSEEIINALTDLILLEGITNGEINNFGLNVEALIDRLGINFQE